MNTGTRKTAAIVGGTLAAAAILAVILVGSGKDETADPADDHMDHDHGSHDHGSHDHGVADGGGFALSASEQGFMLAPVIERIAAEGPVEFRIFGPDGRPVRDFDTTHERDMHLLMVSADLRHYAHLHPSADQTGRWAIDHRFLQQGRWRLVADFQPSGGPKLALGTWLTVGSPTSAAPEPLVAERRTAEAADLQITLTGDLSTAGTGTLTFAVTSNGAPVTAVEPYLGADGHLVGFRADDHAYVHMHPAVGFADGRMTFTTGPVAGGLWAMFLQLKIDGELLTFPFAVEAT